MKIGGPYMTRTYRTSEIANIANVHPNTVRIYEEWGYLSAIPRAENGYRIYQENHLTQLLIARLAFRNELLHKNLRKHATKIVELSGKELYTEALKEAKAYLGSLKEEHSFALKAIETVKQWMSQSTRMSDVKTFTHKEVAMLLNITEETLRNWERNGLFTVSHNTRRHRIYTKEDIERLLVIRSLRSAHFSIAAILRFVIKMNEDQSIDIKNILNTPSTTEEIVHITDRLEVGLREAMVDVEELIRLLEKLIQKEAH